MSMKNILLVFAFVAVALLGAGCKGGKNATGTNKKDPAILTFDNGTEVSKSEFEYIYQKNNGGWEDAKSHTQAQYQEYLDLYLNFKRKVMEAERAGLHETEAFKKEFEGYRKQLAQPYLVERQVQEDLIREAYDRSKYNVSASHILFMVSPDSPPADTLAAFKKAQSIRDSIVNHGKDFATMARRHSGDPSAAQNAGYLGYFSVFDMVYPFETGAYNTPVGSVSKPVRSGYGYHLINVTDKVESTGRKRVSHIIIRIGPQYSAKDTSQAKAKIKEIHDKLEKGADFGELAGLYSDDPVSAKRAGDLGDGRLIPEMEEIKLKLGKGDISEPFNTAFGWHIMTVTESDPIKTFEEAESGLKSRISKDARSYLSRERLIERVKKEGNFTLNQTNIDKFIAHLTDQDMIKFPKGFWRPVDSLHSDLYGLEVYTVGEGEEKQTGTLKEMFDFYVKKRKGFDGSTRREVTEKLVDEFVEAEMLRFEESQLPKKYPEYRELVKEYRDGILLFTLTEDKVWRKAVEDTTGLKEFYENNKNDFKAGKRVVVKEYAAGDKDIMNEVRTMIKTRTEDSEIEHEINDHSSLTLKIRTLTYEQGKSEVDPTVFGWEEGYISEVRSEGSTFKVFVVQEVKPAGIRPFSEAKAEAITQYQNHLESNWLKELEERYPVKVKQDVLESLFN